MRSENCPNCQEPLTHVNFKCESAWKNIYIEEAYVCMTCHYTNIFDWDGIMDNVTKINNLDYIHKLNNEMKIEPNEFNVESNKLSNVESNVESIKDLSIDTYKPLISEFIRPAKIHVDFSLVYGLSKQKRFINMILNQKHTDKMIHVLLDGDPSTSKTFMLEQIATKSNIIQYCKLINGASLTGSGFFEVLDSHRFGWLLIDEIDKLPIEHQPTFLDVLENGRVKSNKYKNHVDFKVDIQVFASSNNSSKLIEPLLSRFNVIYFKKYNKEEMYNIGKNIMTKRYKMKEDISEYAIQKFLLIPNVYIRQIRDFCQLGYDTKEQIDEYFDVTSGILKLY